MNHWLKVELDESTGAVTGRHYASAPYGPEGKQRDVTVHRDANLPESVATALGGVLKAIVDAGRPAVEKELRRARAAAELAAEQRNEFDDKPKADAE